jgi:hypothetical protein
MEGQHAPKRAEEEPKQTFPDFARFPSNRCGGYPGPGLQASGSLCPSQPLPPVALHLQDAMLQVLNQLAVGVEAGGIELFRLLKELL